MAWQEKYPEIAAAWEKWSAENVHLDSTDKVMSAQGCLELLSWAFFHGYKAAGDVDDATPDDAFLGRLLDEIRQGDTYKRLEG